MATATNPNLHTRTLDPLERVRVRVISRIRGPRWNERRRRGVGRGRNEEGNETPVFQRCCIHEAEWTDGRCTLEHELSLSPSVNARLHGARTCPLAIYTEWPPVTWVLNTSIHARSGRIKASHVQFHGTKIFFRGISILLPAPLRRPRVKPRGRQTFTPSLVDESSFATQCTGKRVRDTRGSTSDIWFDSWRRRSGMSDNEERQWSWREKCN